MTTKTHPDLDALIADYRTLWQGMEGIAELVDLKDEDEAPDAWAAFKKLAGKERRLRARLIAAPCDERGAFRKLRALAHPVPTQKNADIEANEVAALIASCRA